MFGGARQPDEPVDFVTYVAKASGLAAVAIYGQIFSPQSLLHEVGDHAAVVQLHARAIGIENPRDPGIHLVITVIGHGRRLGKPLGFVIDRTWPDGVDMSPVSFLLGMLQRIAVA